MKQNYLLKSLVLSLFCLVTINSYSQSTPQEQEAIKYNTYLSEQVIILKLDVSGNSMNNLGELKDEFLKLDGKVLEVDLDETTMKMEVKHNGFLPKTEVLKMLSTHMIPNSAIINYE